MKHIVYPTIPNITTLYYSSFHFMIPKKIGIKGYPIQILDTHIQSTNWSSRRANKVIWCFSYLFFEDAELLRQGVSASCSGAVGVREGIGPNGHLRREHGAEEKILGDRRNALADADVVRQRLVLTLKTPVVGNFNEVSHIATIGGRLQLGIVSAVATDGGLGESSLVPEGSQVCAVALSEDTAVAWVIDIGNAEISSLNAIGIVGAARVSPPNVGLVHGAMHVQSGSDLAGRVRDGPLELGDGLASQVQLDVSADGRHQLQNASDLRML
jgi:hypothetical protein